MPANVPTLNEMNKQLKALSEEKIEVLPYRRSASCLRDSREA
jgi:hypothetical protein